jgi:hypothetical protein
VAILIPSFNMVNLLLYHHCIWDLSLMWLCPSSRKVCKVAREVVGGPRGPIVIIVEVIQCKVD